MISKILFLLLVFVSTQLHAITIATTLPEFGNLAKDILPGAEIIYLLNGTEDAHHIDANPRMIFSLAKADIVLLNGFSFEIAWLNKAITLSGNSKIQINQKGYCDLSSGIIALGVLANIDRSMGDVHIQGNPHYTLSVENMIKVQENIKNCLTLNSQTINEKTFLDKKNRLVDFAKKLKGSIKDKVYYSFHTEFQYLADFLGFKIKRSLERIPGVLPSATYLVEVSTFSKKESPLKVLAALSSSTKTLEKFEEISGIKYIKLSIHPEPGEDFIHFYENLITKVLE